MNKEQVSALNYVLLGRQGAAVANQDGRTGGPQKKKASWSRTILWMLSMVILVNIFMTIIAYVLHFYKVI
jgi:hypothetical protein